MRYIGAQIHMKHVVLALDFGTTLCKCAAHDGERFLAYSEQTVKIDRSAPGQATLSPDSWQTACLEVMKDVLKSSPDTFFVEAIAASTSGPGIILSDKEGRPLLPSPNWQDTRCSPEGKWLFETIGDNWIGQGMPETSLAPRILWYEHNYPDVLKSAARVQDTKGFILSFLTGNCVSDESCSGRAFYDWTKDLLGITSLREEQLDKVLPVDGLAGYLRAPVADQVGLPSGIPVFCGLNDGAAAMLGAGVLAEGDGLISFSTNGVARVLTTRRPASSILKANGLFCTKTVENRWILGGFNKSAGDTLQWIMEVFYGHLSPEQRFDALAEDAARSPVGAFGMQFIPGLYGSGSPHPGSIPCAAFMHMSRSHTRSDFVRATMEGLCYSMKEIGDALAAIESPWKNVCCAGGGMKNPVCRQILADVLGYPLHMVKVDSVLGSAIVAAVCSGKYSNYRSAVKAMVPDCSLIVEPSTERAFEYSELYGDFRTDRKRILPLEENA